VRRGSTRGTGGLDEAVLLMQRDASLPRYESLISADIDRNISERVLGDEFVRGHVELAAHVDSGKAAEQTIVLPVFNQEGFIVRCIEGIAANLSAPTDIAVILDCCTDGSEEAVSSALARLGRRFERVTLVRTTYPLYETRCDNLGFLLSRGDYVIEMQSDIEVLTPGFDALLKSPMIARPDIFSTSGRAGHWFGRLLPKEERKRRFPVRNFIWSRLGFDRVGYSTNTSLQNQAHEGRRRGGGAFALAETVVRGPLCIRRRDLLSLKLLDEQNFFLGFDEYDLHARGVAVGLGCAYVPLRLNIPLAIGSTRKPRSELNLLAYERYRQRTSDPYLTRFLESYRPRVRCRWVR